MIGKLIKFIFTLVIACVIFAGASIAGAMRDHKKEQNPDSEEEGTPQTVARSIDSPYPAYSGEGPLNLEMDYEVQIIGEDALITVLSNLPDSYDLTGELTNIDDIKRQLGYEGISASALTDEQMTEINEKTYYAKEKNFVTNGVCELTFKAPPAGEFELKVTSPATKFQPSSVQTILGEQGVNLEGAYVVYLEEVSDKSINYSVRFQIGQEALPESGTPAE